MNFQYVGILITFIFSAALTGLMVFLASNLGPKKKTSARDVPYECGKDPFALPSERRISVHFYLIAALFIIFDVELSFLFPWAVLFRELGWAGFGSMMFFLFFILLAYLYAWRERALEAD